MVTVINSVPLILKFEIYYFYFAVNTVGCNQSHGKNHINSCELTILLNLLNHLNYFY